MSDKVPSRGFQGAVLKLLRASDYQLTVTGRREVSPRYLRLSFDAGGLLGDRPLHLTMWIRMWFADGEKLHQRGYTLVDPNPVADTVDIEFALHGGVASRWAPEARPGDTIDVTVLGSNFTLPEPAHKGYVIVGDTASLPAINSRLSAIGNAPARVFLEAAHDDDKQLPVARSADVVWVDRKNSGEALVEAVTS
jgi:NADPH-dependent ferric siderophore reductase